MDAPICRTECVHSGHRQIAEYLGDAIDYDEVMRFRKVLADTLRGLKDSQQPDSPVYAYIKNLLPPTEKERALHEPEQSGKTTQTAAPITKPAAEGPSLALLIREGEKAIKEGEKEEGRSGGFPGGREVDCHR